MYAIFAAGWIAAFIVGRRMIRDRHASRRA
jgi:hypothetical protein